MLELKNTKITELNNKLLALEFEQLTKALIELIQSLNKDYLTDNEVITFSDVPEWFHIKKGGLFNTIN